VLEIPALRSILVANRGEIAVRIIRACRELGLRAIAVYSDADADALHVRMADEAHRIGPANARDSYLSAGALLNAARASGADAVHPGYGMLSEDAGFAATVVEAGLVFVGPPPEVIARMGDKVAARAVAQACGIPVPPGSPGTVDASDLAGVTALAHQVGWPVVIKASFGGGGRGMRVVHDAAGLEAAITAAGREAAAAFGRPQVHLERYLARSRHVEVQLMADAHGTVVALGDRDCSVQRRHQKLIEEAPAPDLSSRLRMSLQDAALRIAREVGYVGAGTVEFLVVPATGEYFFLEMNTRLQVEHGVTEMVTGIDLVAAQLAVAAGEKLWFGQGDVRVEGHAIQARIAAEDPWQGFLPVPGRIAGLTTPQGPWVRCDMGVEQGDSVAAEYDSMFGKVLAHGPDRGTARRRLIAALGELRVAGRPTTAPYLREVLASNAFTAVTHDTGSVERDWVPDPATRPTVDALPSPAESGVAPTGVPARRVRISTDRGPIEVAVYAPPPPPGAASVASGRRERANDCGSDRPTGPSAPPIAPMDATVAAVPVQPGQQVDAGEILVVLEAMKMEIEIRAEAAGTIVDVHVGPGDSVSTGTVLATLDARDGQ
jgi:acetyl-CoA/propionyl-CoA carboxylase biotin carboxyl carrier protein